MCLVAVHPSLAGSRSPLRRARTQLLRARRRCASPWRAGRSPPAATWTSTSARAGGRTGLAAALQTCPGWATRTGTWLSGHPGADPGHYFLSARICDQLGQTLEDATAVLLGGPPLPPRDATRLLPPALQADQQAIAAELKVTALHAGHPDPARDRRGAGGAAGQPGCLDGPRARRS